MGKFKNLKLACTFIGTMIGAGFASGREIALYFASTSPLSPLLGGVFCGLFCFVFVEMGRLSNGDILKYSFKKISKIVLILIKLSNIIIFCAMLAGCEYIILRLFNINGGTIISAGLVLICIYLGVEKLKLLNFIIVPLLLVLIGIIYFKFQPDVLPFQSFAFHTPILYACMNILSGGFLISTFAKGLKPSDSLNISLMVTVILSFLLVIIYLLIQDSFNMPMPMLFTASTVGMIKLGCVILYLAVFTTLAGSLYIVTGSDIKKAMFITSIGLVVACFGFQPITDKLYPVIGYFGAFLTLYGIFQLLFKRKKYVSL